MFPELSKMNGGYYPPPAGGGGGGGYSGNGYSQSYSGGSATGYPPPAPTISYPGYSSYPAATTAYPTGYPATNTGYPSSTQYPTTTSYYPGKKKLWPLGFGQDGVQQPDPEIFKFLLKLGIFSTNGSSYLLYLFGEFTILLLNICN